MLSPGTAAPTLALELHDGRRAQLSDYLGKFVILYFYPMDDTPGCRIEARGFRDLKPELDESNTVILGVSRQKAESHRRFIEKEGLNFDLVVDADGRVARAFGVRTLGPLTARRTFLIDPRGIIQAVWPSVSPANHAAEVLDCVRQSSS